MLATKMASSTNSGNSGETPASPGRRVGCWKTDGPAVVALVSLAVYFLKLSWRKWPDPIADSGTQWYTFWRMTHGAALYHDMGWNYGPLSACFNASLFQWFGPGMMV